MVYTLYITYEEVFFKTRLAPFQKMSSQCQCQLQKLYLGKGIFTYVHMCIYVHIYEEFFSTT